VGLGQPCHAGRGPFAPLLRTARGAVAPAAATLGRSCSAPHRERERERERERDTGREAGEVREGATEESMARRHIERYGESKIERERRGAPAPAPLRWRAEPKHSTTGRQRRPRPLAAPRGGRTGRRGGGGDKKRWEEERSGVFFYSERGKEVERESRGILVSSVRHDDMWAGNSNSLVGANRSRPMEIRRSIFFY
jgi:hypothetical protein